MESQLTQSQTKMRHMFREFSGREVLPLAREIDEIERFPVETVQKLADLGWLGLPYEKAMGGLGTDYLTYILCIEELSRCCATTGVIVSTHTSLCSDSIAQNGTPEQCEYYLRPLAKGRMIGAFALTEPQAGTDLSGLSTVATDEGDHFVLNGRKIFITNAGHADVYVVFARTAPDVGTKGISAFIVEKDAPGFRVGRKIPKMGIRGSATHELHFEDCLVPSCNLLGELNNGYKIAMKTLDGGRIGIAAQALGIAQGALDATIEYTKNRMQFGKTLAQFQNTQFELAAMKARIEAARLLVYQAAIAKGNQIRYSQEAAMAKLFASETAVDVTCRCVQLFGGYGYTRDYPIERMMRDAKITEIYEGTSEVQKMVIASQIFH